MSRGGDPGAAPDGPAHVQRSAEVPGGEEPGRTAGAQLAREIKDRRRAAGLSQPGLADAIGYTRQYVSLAERASRLPSVHLVRAIDTALSAGGALIALHARASAERRARRSPSGSLATGRDSAARLRRSVDDIAELATAATRSGTSDDAIVELDRSVASLAESHTQAAPRALLAEALALHGRAGRMLRGDLRLHQRRELYRIEAELLSHVCLLLGDLGHHDSAERCGRAALSYSREAGCVEALPRSALAKTLRWRGRFVESADMARTGFESSPNTAIRAQLAGQEANAAALLGHVSRAREALARSHAAAGEAPADAGSSAWSFPVPRQALFEQCVARRTGEASAALAAAARADDHWRQGHPVVLATWAQIRLGSAIAHVTAGAVDGAADEVEPVLLIPEDLRITTVTGYLVDLTRALRRIAPGGSPTVTELATKCRDFVETALPPVGDR